MLERIEPAYGAARMALSLARGFADNGHLVTVVSLESVSYGFALEHSRDGLRVESPGLGGGKLAWLSRFFWLRTFLKRQKFEVCVGVLTYMNVLSYFASRSVLSRQSTRLIATEHNEFDFRPMALLWKSRLLNSLVRFVYHRVDAVVAVSHGVATSLERSGVLEANKCTVIHNPVEGIQLHEAPPPSPTSTNFVSVGELKSAKNPDVLIRALARSKAAATLHFVGDGELRGELEKLVFSLCLDSQVVFHGRVDDVPALVCQFDTLLHFPRYEGYGLVVIEAAAAGLSLACSGVGGLRDVLSGIGVQPLTEARLGESLVDAVTAVFEGRAMARRPDPIAMNEWLSASSPMRVAAAYARAWGSL